MQTANGNTEWLEEGQLCSASEMVVTAILCTTLAAPIKLFVEFNPWDFTRMFTHEVYKKASFRELREPSQDLVSKKPPWVDICT